MIRAAALLALFALSACGALGLAADAAVGTAQLGLGAVDAAL